MAKTLKDRILPFYGIREDYKVVFESKHGERVLKHLMKIGYVSQPIQHPDAREETARAGMQRLVLSILKQLHMDTGDIKIKIEETYDDELQTTV